ncbi:SixA phosphatase family protein [Nocardiopsis coralliicola]
MTRHLILLRHAQAEHGSGTDRERQLTAHGRAQADAVGALLADRGIVPDRVICSPAARTRETLALVLGRLPKESAPEAVDYDEAAYGADTDTWFDLLRVLPDDAGTVLAVGHNPAIAQLASDFMEDGEPVSFPPASTAAVQLEVPWLYVAPGTGTGELLTR